jgi:ABC-type transport system involved in cytochrome bd biosynthesis fused ATPase/permease subunit
MIQGSNGRVSLQTHGQVKLFRKIGELFHAQAAAAAAAAAAAVFTGTPKPMEHSQPNSVSPSENYGFMREQLRCKEMRV